MRQALIFCPYIDGHRQAYCAFLSDWFLRYGFRVFLAIGRSFGDHPSMETPLMSMLTKRQGVSVIDLGDVRESHLVSGKWVKTVRRMEEELLPEWTFFPTGDELIISLDGLGKRSGSAGPKRAAIFIATTAFYSRRYSGMNIRGWYHHWQDRRRAKSKEGLYFRDTVWDALGLDIAFSTNEDFLRQLRQTRLRYLPEIYRTWTFDISEQSDKKWYDRIRQLCDEYAVFLSQHPGKDVILYYGGWAARRGYDTLLRLVREEPGTLFVSCGRPIADDRFCYDVDMLRYELRQEKRIFEIELPFLPDNELVDFLFRSCKYVLLPYRNFYGPSASLIQAASFGKPVLVPDIGYANSMVRKFNIGLTYRDDDYADLIKQFSILRRIFNRYVDNALQFGEQFKKENIYDTLARALL